MSQCQSQASQQLTAVVEQDKVEIWFKLFYIKNNDYLKTTFSFRFLQNNDVVNSNFSFWEAVVCGCPSNFVWHSNDLIGLTGF